jgi:hypothetical protein
MRNIFKRNIVWSIAIYERDLDFSFSQKLNNPINVIDSKKIRKHHKHVHTYADPFFYVYNDELYIFFESQSIFEKGKIEVFKTFDLKNFEFLGTILEERFHVSYPFIFEFKQSIYLMPESLKENEIALYKFEKFPFSLSKYKVLLQGTYSDSSLVEHGGVYYLFTTSERGFEIFYTEDIEQNALLPHPCNPITRDLRYSRNGGAPVKLNNELYRITQDCSVEYGQNIHIMMIKVLSPIAYEEILVHENYFEKDAGWNSKGGHHLSIIDFHNKKIIAVDGKQYDHIMNKFLAPFYWC